MVLETNANEKDNLKENIEHQKSVIKDIRERVKNLFLDVYHTSKYNYISEKRTYKTMMTLDSIEQLIKSDIYTGEADRANLDELNKDNPDINKFRKNHKVLRSANELRAASKNDLDENFKNLIKKGNK